MQIRGPLNAAHALRTRRASCSPIAHARIGYARLLLCLRSDDAVNRSRSSSAAAIRSLLFTHDARLSIGLGGKMKEVNANVDRRHSFRVAVDGLALLWCKDRIAGRYRVADLSIGGCLLRDGPICEV